MKLFEKFFDAAVALAVATAILYFWGYVYYAAYTEKAGVPFHGIAISPQEYITASWYAVIILLLAIVAITILEPVATALVDGLADYVRKKTGKPPLSKEERGLLPSSPVAVLALSAFALIGGTKIMLSQGQDEAEKVLRMAPEVRIWAPDGKQIAGRFVYLRNFGSTLLVREMSEDMKTPVGLRLFKESTFGSYSLVPESWTVKWRPATDKLP